MAPTLNDADRQELLNRLKIEFRGILLSAGHNGVKISELERDYRDLNGRPVPYAELGYSHINQFLSYEMQDVCTFWQDYFGNVVLFPVSHESTQHLERLIARQRVSRTSRFSGQLQLQQAQQQQQQHSRSVSRGGVAARHHGPSFVSHRGGRSIPARTRGGLAGSRAPTPSVSKGLGQQPNKVKASAVSATSTAKRPATAVPSTSGVGLVGASAHAQAIASSRPTPLVDGMGSNENKAPLTAAATVAKVMAASGMAPPSPLPQIPVMSQQPIPTPQQQPAMTIPLAIPSRIVTNSSGPTNGVYIPVPGASTFHAASTSYMPPMTMPSIALIPQPRQLQTTGIVYQPLPLPAAAHAPVAQSSPAAKHGGPYLVGGVTFPGPSITTGVSGSASSAASLLEQIKSSVEKISFMPSVSTAAPTTTTAGGSSLTPPNSASAKPSANFEGKPQPSAVPPPRRSNNVASNSPVYPSKFDKPMVRKTPEEIRAKNPDMYDKIKANVEKLLTRYCRRGVNYELFPQVYEAQCHKLPNTVEDLFGVSWRELLLSTKLCYIDHVDIMRPTFDPFAVTGAGASGSNPPASQPQSCQSSAGPSPAKPTVAAAVAAAGKTIPADKTVPHLPLKSPIPPQCAAAAGPSSPSPNPFVGSAPTAPSRKPQDVRNWINESRGKQFYENDNATGICDLNLETLPAESTKAKRSIAENSELEKLRRNCKRVLIKYPSGIRHHDFAMAYSRIIGEPLNLDSLNIFSVVELVDIFPDVFAQDATSSDLMLLNSTCLSDEPNESLVFNAHLPRQPLPQKDLFEALMLQCNSPNNFYIQLKAYEVHLNELMHSLNDFLEQNDTPQFRMTADQLKPGLFCSAWYEENGWHRAEVLLIKSFSSISCFYVDFGTVALVPFDKLRILPKQFYSLPAQAIKCRLGCIKPENGDDYSTEANERFADITFNKTFWAQPCGTEEDGCLNIIITLTDQETDIHVNDLLVLENFAVLLYEPNVPVDDKSLQNAQDSEGASCNNENNELLSDEDFEYYSAQADISNSGPPTALSNGVEDEEVINSEDEEVLLDGVDGTVGDMSLLLPDLEVEIKLMKRARSVKCLNSKASLSVIRTVLLLRRTGMLRETMNNNAAVRNLVDKVKWLESSINWLSERIGDSGALAVEPTAATGAGANQSGGVDNAAAP